MVRPATGDWIFAYSSLPAFTPLGAKLLRTSAVPAGKLIGLDKNYALEHICGSEVMVEYDKLIDRQIERAAITSISGFAKPYQEAYKVLTV